MLTDSSWVRATTRFTAKPQVWLAAGEKRRMESGMANSADQPPAVAEAAPSQTASQSAFSWSSPKSSSSNCTPAAFRPKT